MRDVLGWRRKFGVIGPSTNAIVQPDFEMMGPVGVTNHYSRIFTPNAKAVSNETFMAGIQVIGERTKDANPKFEAWLAEYEAAVKLYRARDFKGALDKFERCLDDQREDFLCGMYIKECENFLQNPPYDSWNGVFVITEK